jgi:hypothetical protein
VVRWKKEKYLKYMLVDGEEEEEDGKEVFISLELGE